MDEYSHLLQAFPMVNKSEASEKVVAIVRWFERQTGQSVTSFYTDGGTEFNHARKTLEAQGVDTDGSMAYTCASNGLPERHMALFLQSTRAALNQAKLPITYRDYAVRHVAWSNNMVLTARLKMTPHELAIGHSCPEIHHFRPFCCRCCINL